MPGLFSWHELTVRIPARQSSRIRGAISLSIGTLDRSNRSSTVSCTVGITTSFSRDFLELHSFRFALESAQPSRRAASFVDHVVYPAVSSSRGGPRLPALPPTRRGLPPRSARRA